MVLLVEGGEVRMWCCCVGFCLRRLGVGNGVYYGFGVCLNGFFFFEVYYVEFG